MRCLVLAFGGLLLAGSAGAVTVPSSGVLAFDVMREGSDIGDHRYTFRDDGEALSVQVETDVAVKLPLIGVTVYRFEHESHETWQDGRLSALRSTTNDDGQAHQVDLADAEGFPASLWNDAILRQTVLLNTVDGRSMAASAIDVGPETVQANGKTVPAHHYRLSGDLTRDLWYDASGMLVKVAFTADDGSHIEYTLK
ncbi:MAG: DUF6134 family protein [Geminicoccaceae bacterium]